MCLFILSLPLSVRLLQLFFGHNAQPDDQKGTTTSSALRV